MDKSTKLLKIAGIINLFIGILAIEIPLFREILLVSGFILYIISNEKYLNKKLLYLLAIILLPFNLIVAILIFIAIDKLDNIYFINGPPSKVKFKESTKLDLLLKIGIGMIAISGIFFATNTWEYINSYFKITILLSIGIFFLILSSTIENKLKIFKTTYIYWLLSMTFFVLIFTTIFQFSIFGSFISYQGLGKDIAYGITFFVITGLLYATHLKFSKQYLIYLTYLTLTITIYNMLRHFIPNIYILIIFSITIFLINIFSKKNTTLQNYSKLLSLLFLSFQIQFFKSNNLLLTLSGIINILNSNYLAIKEEDQFFEKIHLLISYIFIFTSFSVTNISDSIKYLAISIFLSVNIYLTKFNVLKLKNKTISFNYIFYSLTLFLLFLLVYEQNSLISLVIALIYSFTNFVVAIKQKNSNLIKIANNLKPLTIFFLVVSLVNLDYLKNLKIFSQSGAFVVATIILIFIHIFLKTKKQKTLYLKYILISFILTIINIKRLQEFEVILQLIPSIYIFYLASTLKKEKLKLNLSYSVLIYTIYTIIIKYNIFNITSFYSILVFTLILILFLVIIKNKDLKQLNYFILIFPLYEFLNLILITEISRLLIKSILILYLTWILCKYFLSSKESKNIFGILGIIISFQEIIYIDNYIINLFIGFIGLSILLISYNNKNLLPLFITGITITILNILLSLKYLFESTPFWIYLFIGGLIIILFVTIKELQTKNKDTYLH